jgi:hypothetical protein
MTHWIAALCEHHKVSLLGRVARGRTGLPSESVRRFRSKMMQGKAAVKMRRTGGALREPPRTLDFAQVSHSCPIEISPEVSWRRHPMICGQTMSSQ